MLEDVVEVAEKKTLIMAPKSMSVSIAANGKETDQFAGAKYDCKTTKGATSGANFSKQVKEKRSRAGRPPKNSNQQIGTVKERKLSKKQQSLEDDDEESDDDKRKDKKLVFLSRSVLQ